MKRYIKIISGLFLFSLVAACSKKESISQTETTVGRSKVIFFPSLSVKGDQLMIVQPGGTFTDPGATATLNNQPVQYTTSGTVNLATPGIYILNYEAKNEQGFAASDYRTVVVIGNDVSANNYSGTYARHVSGAPNGQTSTWTKIANGVYTVVNPGGATGVTATAVNYTGTKIAIPQQETAAGTFSSTDGVYYPNAVPPYFEWKIVNPGYGTALRTFIKQ
jgi:hypothetical protein